MKDKRVNLPDEEDDPAGDFKSFDPPCVEELYHARD